MPVEDLVAPVDDGVDDVVELGQLAGGVEVGESVEGFEGTGAVVGLVEPIELLEGVPGVSQPGGWALKRPSRRAWSCSLRWSCRRRSAKRARNTSGSKAGFTP